MLTKVNHAAMLVGQKAGSFTELLTGAAGTASELNLFFIVHFCEKIRENEFTAIKDGHPE
jgi:hypothetical protein